MREREREKNEILQLILGKGGATVEGQQRK